MAEDRNIKEEHMIQLDAKLQDWVCAQWLEQVWVKDIVQLKGGVSSTIYRLTIVFSEEIEKCYVLRVIYPTDPLGEDKGILLREAEVLRQLQALTVVKEEKGLVADFSSKLPHCIAVDAYGQSAGVPALLMTYIDGKVDLPHEPSQEWISQLAQAIAFLHQTTFHFSQLEWNYLPYASSQLASHPAYQWSARPILWRQLIDYVKNDTPSYTPCLIHRDYHPTNVLWREGQLVGIVDWVNGCIGAPGVDVGHCRSNLVQLYGLSVANEFLEAYMQCNPNFKYDPYWDIRCLMDMTAFGEVEVYAGWTAIGFSVLNEELIKQRIDQYVIDLVQLTQTNRYIK